MGYGSLLDAQVDIPWDIFLMNNVTDLPLSLSVAFGSAALFSELNGYICRSEFPSAFSLPGGRGVTKTEDHYGVSHGLKFLWRDVKESLLVCYHNHFQMILK